MFTGFWDCRSRDSGHPRPSWSCGRIFGLYQKARELASHVYLSHRQWISTLLWRWAIIAVDFPPLCWLIYIPEFAFYVNKNGWRSRKEFMVFWEGSPTGFGEIPCCFSSGHYSHDNMLALHYPYVLAFEPTFVEIRHVETGLMSQVIQGNNLRLIFADTPPSTTNTAGPAYHNPPYGGAPQGYNPYANPYASRPSLQSTYAPPQHMGYPNNYPRPAAQPFGRDEILMVSDDRVLTLRLATPAQQAYASDTASMMSIPRWHWLYFLSYILISDLPFFPHLHLTFCRWCCSYQSCIFHDCVCSITHLSLHFIMSISWLHCIILSPSIVPIHC